ncbi:hypothetical protein, conserved [Entamoeba dispar SAW760]|uniref:AIG1-type G domain-containing protein n=1 Tax=Entamoeba dispar (strain ATCC PRA-260 / SAW760) TaxID=370354 RepID=B0EG99_ENTDS|nr:uncharacterized protein EDI_234310 [Entamoeba dispar SAW760]EDR26445.1 hypothetical protein, conserved [Entamoeba dispar SAW760]|eukprot:EDR26445.1 hypothetical protein, conserved [Entamoeba dispar SAW760]
MKSENPKLTKMIMIGGTGDGKSSLGNFVLKKKDKSNAFRVSSEPNSQTQETIGSYGENDRENVFVIDTPGFQDSHGAETDTEHIKQMVDYIKKQKGIQAIVIVLSIHSPRLSDGIRTMIEIISNIFPISDFWEHVCIVWTKCYNYTPEEVIKQDIEIKKQDYYKELLKLAREITGVERIVLPMYFVDSKPIERLDNTRSDNEIKSLLGWARCLRPINVDKIKTADATYKMVIKEEKEFTEIIEVKKEHIKLKIYMKRREKRIPYRGKVSYTEWKQINSRIIFKPIIQQLADTSKEGFQKLLNEVGDSMFGFVTDGIVSRDRLML